MQYGYSRNGNTYVYEVCIPFSSITVDMIPGDNTTGTGFVGTDSKVIGIEIMYIDNDNETYQVLDSMTGNYYEEPVYNKIRYRGIDAWINMDGAAKGELDGPILYEEPEDCDSITEKIIKLLPDKNSRGNRSAKAVDISSGYAIFGSYLNDQGAKNAGAVYIYKRECGEWIFLQKIINPEPAIDDWFGYSVAISEKHAVIGVVYDDSPKSNAGSVYIYELQDELFVLQEKLVAHDAYIEDNFGSSISISDCDNYLMISAWNDDHSGKRNAGSAYIYKKVENGWEFMQKIISTNPQVNDVMGLWQVSITDKFAIVGAQNDDYGTEAGAAYIFKRSGESWGLDAILYASDASPRKYFGRAVSISDCYAIVGSTYDFGATGAAYIFKRTTNGWIQVDKLVAPDAAHNDQFGYKVAIYNNYAIVGSRLDDNETGINAGSAYIYKYINGKWEFYEKVVGDPTSASDEFGHAVAIHKKYAIVGALFDDEKVANSGAAYIIKMENLLKSATVQLDNLPVTNENMGTLAVYPNPFTDETTISFNLDNDSKILLEIIDITGQKIEEIYNGHYEAGEYKFSWIPDADHGSILFIRLQTNDFVEVRKCINMK